MKKASENFSHDYKDIQNIFWDVIVVGTGMGGATTGYELARQGRKVLFLERGHFLSRTSLNIISPRWNHNDEKFNARLSEGQWPKPTKGVSSFGKRDSFLTLGCGTGGSSLLYAAQLERMHPLDFKPKINYPEICDSSLPDAWPIVYSDLIPYYKKAESLYKVNGTHDPLNKDTTANFQPPPPLTFSNQKFFKDLIKLGFNPYRSHVACDFIAGCDGCAGVVCKYNCKNDAGKICLVPAVEVYGAKIITNCEVVKLNATLDRVTGVVCQMGNNLITIRAEIIVLAAGALSTPELLLKSKSDYWPNGLANRSGYVGLNLMWHVSDIFAIKPKNPNGVYESKRQISFNDFYLINGKKLGNVQEMGFNWFTKDKLSEILKNRIHRLGLSFLIGKRLLGFFTKIAYFRFHGSAMYASIVEDLPYLRNRVFLKEGELVYEYHYSKDLKKRSKLLRTLLSKKLESKYKVILLSNKDNINYGHACGTCRFGENPETSVLNGENRSHDIRNLFITDSSFFPSSSGVNPSLTIAANALRVAEIINRNWSQKESNNF